MCTYAAGNSVGKLLNLLGLKIGLQIQIQTYSLSLLGQDQGYAVKHTPLPEGVPEGETCGTPEGKWYI